MASFDGNIGIPSGGFNLKVEYAYSQSIEGNYTDISATGYVKRNNSSYYPYNTTSNASLSINGDTNTTHPSFNLGSDGYKEIISHSVRVYHNEDGTKTTTISFSFNGLLSNYYPNGSISQEITLPTIPRASSIACNGGNIGESTNIQVSRASSNFTHTITYSFGDLSGTIVNKVSSTSINWIIPTSFYAEIPDSNTGNITLNCMTYNGNTLIGTKSIACEAKVTNSNPVFNDNQLTYLDSNSSIVAITENNQHIVRNNSNLKVTYTAATPKNSARISSYEITFNGTTQTKNAAATIDYGRVNLSNDAVVSVKAIDSRGNSTTISKTITILNWVNPTLTISAGRVNNYEDDTKIKISSTYSRVDNKNSIQSIICRYKKTDESTYSNETSLTDNTTNTIIIDKLYAWDLRIIITDKFGNTTYNLTIAKGMPIVFVDVEKLSVGINCFPENNNEVRIEGDLIENGNPVGGYAIGDILITADTSNPSTRFSGTTWQRQTVPSSSFPFYCWKRTS